MYNEAKAHYIVATCIILKDYRYLITKRAAKEKTFPNKWTVPGGTLEISDYANRPKDTSQHWYNVLADLTRREVFEETGLKIKNINYLTDMTYFRPDKIPTLILSMYADYASGEIKLDSSLSDYAWVTLDEAMNYELIEGILEELMMLDKKLKGENGGEWKK